MKVSWDDEIPDIWIKIMFQTTKQLLTFVWKMRKVARSGDLKK
jgi:hypothetical protein